MLAAKFIVSRDIVSKKIRDNLFKHRTRRKDP